MPKLRYVGPAPIQAWNGLRLKHGDTIDVSDERAKELLAVEPASIEVEEFRPRRIGEQRQGRGLVKVKKPNPKAGRPIRPEWEPVSKQPAAGMSPAKSAGKE